MIRNLTEQEICPATPARILEEECAIAFSDIRLLPGCPELPDAIARAVSSFEIITTTTKDGAVIERKKFTLWPKGASLERLERYHGLFEKDNNQKPALTTPPQINLFIRQGDNLVQQSPLVGLIGEGEQLDG